MSIKCFQPTHREATGSFAQWHRLIRIPPPPTIAEQLEGRRQEPHLLQAILLVLGARGREHRELHHLCGPRDLGLQCWVRLHCGP
jgi:hypothetical protein